MYRGGINWWGWGSVASAGSGAGQSPAASRYRSGYRIDWVNQIFWLAVTLGAWS